MLGRSQIALRAETGTIKRPFTSFRVTSNIKIAPISHPGCDARALGALHLLLVRCTCSLPRSHRSQARVRPQRQTWTGWHPYVMLNKVKHLEASQETLHFVQGDIKHQDRTDLPPWVRCTCSRCVAPALGALHLHFAPDRTDLPHWFGHRDKLGQVGIPMSCCPQGTLCVNEVKHLGASRETLRFAHSQSALRAG